jgi:hypothetical protein
MQRRSSRSSTAICTNKTNPLRLEQSIIFAESEYLLRCIQRERIAIIERLSNASLQPLVRGDIGPALAEARLEQSKLAFEELVKLRPSVAEKGLLDAYFGDESANPSVGQERPDQAAPSDASRLSDASGRNRADAATDPLITTRPGERTEAEALLLALPDLARLDRYERRAWSRRKRALRKMMLQS